MKSVDNNLETGLTIGRLAQEISAIANALQALPHLKDVFICDGDPNRKTDYCYIACFSLSKCGVDKESAIRMLEAEKILKENALAKLLRGDK